MLFRFGPWVKENFKTLSWLQIKMLLAISAGHVLTQHWLLVLKKEVYYFLTERVSAKFLASQNTAKR